MLCFEDKKNEAVYRGDIHRFCLNIPEVFIQIFCFARMVV